MGVTSQEYVKIVDQDKTALLQTHNNDNDNGNDEDKVTIEIGRNMYNESKSYLRRIFRYRYIFMLIIVIANSFLLIYMNSIRSFRYNEDEQRDRTWLGNYYNHTTGEHDSFTIKTSGCMITGMKPFSEETKGYVKYPYDAYKCPKANHSLINTNKTHMWLNKAEYNYYKINSSEEVTCCYKGFYRSDSVGNVFSSLVDDRATYKSCINFTDVIKVKDEFTTVACLLNGHEVYKQYFIFAPFKKINLHDNVKEINITNKPSYNVIVMGIDAVSRLNFHRTMPKTQAYFKNKGAIELLGYTRIADNSYPNIVAALLGYTASEIGNICLPYRLANFDSCPFIWNQFKKAGYYTAFAEDSSYAGTFNYARAGFIGTPTDYYAHPFIHQAERNAGTNNLHMQKCFQDKYAYQVILDYIEDIMTTLKGHRLFGFFWEVTMSHDYLNYPMVIDDSYEAFFKKLEASKYLDESIIFLISDHGLRYGSFRHTNQGRLEENLPLVYALLPPTFKANYTEAYRNLKINSKRLTTPFDFHETLMDLVHLDKITNKKIMSRSEMQYAQKRSISLFLPIPDNRTCEAAGIADHWCACYRSVKISKNSKEAVAAAAHMIKHLNTLLEQHSRCAKLSVAEVLEAAEIVMARNIKSDKWREYMVAVRASPSDALFEGTLRFDKRNWTVSGSISRTNLYGDESKCTQYASLKPYCFCI